MNSSADALQEFEQARLSPVEQRYVLQLFISGASPISFQAITNLKKLCQEHLAGRHELEIIDIYQQPQLAFEEQVVAAPMLIKKLPFPLRRLIGNLSNTSQTHSSLGLNP